MKITEITEGFVNTDEAFADAWSTVKKTAGAIDKASGGSLSAIGGAAGRSAVRGLRSVGAMMGSGKAQGALQLDKAIMGVMKNYQRYLGQSSLDQTQGSLETYLRALGIENPVMERRGIMPQKAQNLRNRMKGMPKPQKPQTQQPAQQAPAAGGKKDASTKLSRNQVAEIIRKNLEAALKTGSLPKELKKFLGQ